MKRKKTIKLSTLKLNTHGDAANGIPKNPRFIRSAKFTELVKSIKDNTAFLPARGIVVDENNLILGGNMRFRALKALGHTEVPAEWITVLPNLTPEQKRRFIYIDNHTSGEDDLDALANEWNIDELKSFGMSAADMPSTGDDIGSTLCYNPRVDIEPADNELVPLTVHIPQCKFQRTAKWCANGNDVTPVGMGSGIVARMDADEVRQAST